MFLKSTKISSKFFFELKKSLFMKKKKKKKQEPIFSGIAIFLVCHFKCFQLRPCLLSLFILRKMIFDNTNNNGTPFIVTIV